MGTRQKKSKKIGPSSLTEEHRFLYKGTRKKVGTRRLRFRHLNYDSCKSAAQKGGKGALSSPFTANRRMKRGLDVVQARMKANTWCAAGLTRQNAHRIDRELKLTLRACG